MVESCALRVQKHARKFGTAMALSPATEARPPQTLAMFLTIRSLPLTHPWGFPFISLVPTARFSSAIDRARVGDAKIKMPDGLATGHFTLATSYSRTACRRTTIGAAAFHFRVRNGNGWGHCAIVT